MRRLGAATLISATAGTVLFVAVWLGLGGEGLRAGLAFVFQSPERWLALVACGFCLATRTSRVPWVAALAAASGAALGMIAPHSPLWPWITRADIFPAHHFLGPGACLVVGVALLASARWRRPLLPLAFFAVVGALSLTAALNDPALHGAGFVTGALVGALALVLVSAAARRLASGRWTGVGERIAGSWLLTIGLLLSALRLAPAPAPTVELAPPATAPVWNAPDVPGFVPPARRDADPFAGASGHGGLPMGTN